MRPCRAVSVARPLLGLVLCLLPPGSRVEGATVEAGRDLQPVLAGRLAAAALPALPAGVLAGLDGAVAAQLEAKRAEAERATTAGHPAEARARLAGELGGLYLLYGLYEPAQQALAQAERLAPGEFRWSYLLGFAHQTAGGLDDAVAAYARALELSPDHLASLLRLGELRLLVGEPGPAADLFRRALAVSGDCGACRFGLGRAAAAADDDEEAVRQLEMALELQPEAKAIHHALAQAYRRLGRLEPARREYEAAQLAEAGEVMVPDPIFAWVRSLATGSAVHVQRGQRALSAGDLGAAERQFRQAVELNPESARARRALGLALRRLRRLDEAVEQYREAVRLAPASGVGRKDLALAFADAERFEEAERQFRVALELEPEFAEAEHGLGIVLGRLGRADEALAHLGRALALQPTNQPARFEKALIELRLGRLEDARAGLAEILERDADHHPARLNLALVHEMSNRPAAAETQLRELLRRRPRPRLAASARLALGRLAERGGDLEGARREYQEALTLSADLLPARLRLASVAAASGDLSAAAAGYQRALAAAPGHRDARLAAASALLMAGREREAAGLLDEGLERNGSEPLLLGTRALIAATAADAAVRDARLALDLSGRAQAALPSLLNAQVVALALFESGRRQQAIAAMDRTVAELAATAPEPLARAARLRLESLRAGRPIRAPWLEDPNLVFPAALPLGQANGE